MTAPMSTSTRTMFSKRSNGCMSSQKRLVGTPGNPGPVGLQWCWPRSVMRLSKQLAKQQGDSLCHSHSIGWLRRVLPQPQPRPQDHNQPLTKSHRLQSASSPKREIKKPQHLDSPSKAPTTKGARMCGAWSSEGKLLDEGFGPYRYLSVFLHLLGRMRPGEA